MFGLFNIRILSSFVHQCFTVFFITFLSTSIETKRLCLTSVILYETIVIHQIHCSLVLTQTTILLQYSHSKQQALKVTNWWKLHL